MQDPQNLTVQQAIDIALQHHIAGRLSDAESLYREILQTAPNQPVAIHYLGVIAHQVGKNEMAVDLINKALAIKPDYAEAQNNLGITLLELARPDEAAASYQKALAIKPDFAEAHSNLGLALQELGRSHEAFISHRRAVVINPQNNHFWVCLGQSLMALSFASIDEDLFRDLLHLINQPNVVRPSFVVQPIISGLLYNRSFSDVLEQMDATYADRAFSYGEIARQLSAIPLFLQILKLCPISDLKIERMLTRLRHEMIREMGGGPVDKAGIPFAVALALQCHTNEYIYPETAEESVVIQRLESQIKELMEKTLDVEPSLILALAAYRPLDGYSWAKTLRDREWDGLIKEVLVRQISEPLEERSLRPRIRRLTPINNSISRSVRAQYEESPYPRWIHTTLSQTAKSIQGVIKGAPLHFDLADYTSPDEPEILIAGCGTGQHALTTALRFKDARVLAVDLSLSSLAYARRKTKELNIHNIEYAQADIMELARLERSFDVIECLGVLHHLENPLAGWRVLEKLLRPGGIMKIGLYSEIARQCVVVARSLIADRNYASSPDDMRCCRQEIITLAGGGNEMIKKIISFRSFYSLSECRDLLFHVQEHRFSLLQIESDLALLNLKFLGFEMQNQRTMEKFKASFPGKNALTSLSQWQKYELKNPDAFRGMYQFWCQKM